MMEMSASAPLRGNRAYISLGSNLGDSLQTLRRAAVALGALGTVVAASPVYETDPVELTEQPAFLNAVVGLDTTLEPLPLLRALLAIETDSGRERGIRFGPRTLDLDLIWYDGLRLESDRLTLPHPRAHEREFVLRPLADIAPGIALRGETVAALLEHLPPQGVRATGTPLM
jgi:2-amino-4-hydroxy-6-hydroxymethyldihydropteridine diphosphokinase